MKLTKFYVTTSRGWFKSAHDTAKAAYSELGALTLVKKGGLEYKIVRATPYRLKLGNPLDLDINAAANIVIIDEVAYSFLSERAYFKQLQETGGSSWVCPYTDQPGLFDYEWETLWS